MLLDDVHRSGRRSQGDRDIPIHRDAHDAGQSGHRETRRASRIGVDFIDRRDGHPVFAPAPRLEHDARVPEPELSRSDWPTRTILAATKAQSRDCKERVPGHSLSSLEIGSSLRLLIMRRCSRAFAPVSPFGSSSLATWKCCFAFVQSPRTLLTMPSIRWLGAW